MKMAKASEADISMAMTMANILDDIERGYFPTKLASNPESEETEWLETASCEQYERLIYGMKRVLNQGSIFRVIWGMAVVCDPSNELLDPTSDVLAVHPKLTQALEQRDDAVKTAAAVNAQFEAISRQRDELLAALECEIPLAAESVISYLYALGDEAKARGGMFPQCSEEHRSDSDAIRRVVELVRWYANNGGGYPTTDAVRTMMLNRARNSGKPAPSFSAIASVKGGA